MCSLDVDAHVADCCAVQFVQPALAMPVRLFVNRSDRFEVSLTSSRPALAAPLFLSPGNGNLRKAIEKIDASLG